VVVATGVGRVIEPGSLLDGKYLIKSVLGRGGMGCVFRAEHALMQKDCAVKVLSPERFDPKNWQRFEVEGKVIAKLDHPAIVKVYDMGVDQGDCPFYVMDLLDGVALSEFCGGDWQPSVHEVLMLFREIAAGIGYAHNPAYK
jgi:serine/threonine protein kinase